MRKFYLRIFAHLRAVDGDLLSNTAPCLQNFVKITRKYEDANNQCIFSQFAIYVILGVFSWTKSFQFSPLAVAPSALSSFEIHQRLKLDRKRAAKLYLRAEKLVDG